MGELRKDLEGLREYKAGLQLNIMERFQISKDQAALIMELLEQQDFLKLEAPEVDNKPATMLTEDRHVIKRELGMTSHKLGNIWINTYLDWRELARCALDLVGTGAGLEWGNPLVFWISIIGAIFAASSLADIRLDANQTAIIMALQKYDKHGYYRTDEEKCFEEANSILDMHAYHKMEKAEFLEKISELLQYGCIDKIGNMIKLKEKILTHF